VRPIAHIELRAVQWTDQHRPAQAALAQAAVGMRTVVDHGSQFTLDPTDHDAEFPEIGKGAHLALVEIRQVTEVVQVAHIGSMSR